MKGGKGEGEKTDRGMEGPWGVENGPGAGVLGDVADVEVDVDRRQRLLALRDLRLLVSNQKE